MQGRWVLGCERRTSAVQDMDWWRADAESRQPTRLACPGAIAVFPVLFPVFLVITVAVGAAANRCVPRVSLRWIWASPWCPRISRRGSFMRGPSA